MRESRRVECQLTYYVKRSEKKKENYEVFYIKITERVGSQELDPRCLPQAL